MPKLRFFTIICMSFLLVFIFACNKGSNEGEAEEASTQEHEQSEQAGPERGQGEHEEEGEGEHEGESEEHAEGREGEGEELGPTEPISLEPGKKADVKLSAEGQSFEWWKAHAEVGESEHR